MNALSRPVTSRFGSSPALSALVSAEATPENIGRIQGANYAISSIGWASGPFLYWYMFDVYANDDGFLSDDDASTTRHKHLNNEPASLFWWVSLGVLVAAAAIMQFVVGDSKQAKLKHGAA